MTHPFVRNERGLAPGQLTKRWTPLRPHSEQQRCIGSCARFNVVPAGRRSGKTELVGKRKIVWKALMSHRADLPQHYCPFQDPRFFVGAPTREQARRIYWNDLKALIPSRFVVGKPSETQLFISLVNGAEIWCLGMDKPERIEGVAWDGGVLDEYGNMKKDTWREHIRPALSDRMGWCDFIGVPEGRNHYYELYREAIRIADACRRKGIQPEWDAFHWISADILPPEEIEAARRDLDELTYLQEYEASFVNFSGRAYWPFEDKLHIGKMDYNPKGSISFCFDFNVEPGCACVIQEQEIPQRMSGVAGVIGDGVIGEVWIPRNSNTIRVCDRLIKDWKKHEGAIYCYGDFTGGQRSTSSDMGSDWELIKRKLWGAFGSDRVYFRVKQNPRERDRINSVNSRLLSINKTVRMMVDPVKAPYVIKDFEGVSLLEGGSGEIDKRKDQNLTHLTDGIGYRTWYEYPVRKEYGPMKEKYWK